MNPLALLFLGGAAIGGYFLLKPASSSKKKNGSSSGGSSGGTKKGAPSPSSKIGPPVSVFSIEGMPSPYKPVGITWAVIPGSNESPLEDPVLVEYLETEGIDIYAPIDWEPVQLLNSNAINKLIARMRNSKDAKMKDIGQQIRNAVDKAKSSGVFDSWGSLLQEKTESGDMSSVLVGGRLKPEYRWLGHAVAMELFASADFKALNDPNNPAPVVYMDFWTNLHPNTPESLQWEMTKKLWLEMKRGESADFDLESSGIQESVPDILQRFV